MGGRGQDPLAKGPDKNRLKTGAIIDVVSLDPLLWVEERGSGKNTRLL